MSPSTSRRLPVAIIVLAAAIAVACSDSGSTSPVSSITAGLNEVTANDSGKSGAGSAVTDGPGYFQGTVMAPSAPGAGNDSLTTAPRIAGVVVTIYPRIAAPGDTISHGPSAGSVTTDASGHFQLPTLPAGDYVVTFVPPANSPYYGAWAFGPLRSNSASYPWWVVLAKKS